MRHLGLLDMLPWGAYPTELELSAAFSAVTSSGRHQFVREQRRGQRGQQSDFFGYGALGNDFRAHEGKCADGPLADNDGDIDERCRAERFQQLVVREVVLE